MQVRLEILRQFVELDGLLGDRIEVPRLDVPGDARPHCEPQFTGRIDGIDPEQTDRAQDEGQDGRIQCGLAASPTLAILPPYIVVRVSHVR